MKPTVGRIVHYRLSEEDAEVIHARREHARDYNMARAGDVVPLIIVRVWPDEYGTGFEGVNGQALLDGFDSLWVTSRKEGAEPGTWSWPARETLPTSSTPATAGA